jgi:hypothetical protein
MLFLLQYDRILGQVVALRSYASSQRMDAEKARLELELQHAKLAQTPEIVLLEAADEAALRRTHNRYFERLVVLTTTGSLAG